VRNLLQRLWTGIVAAVAGASLGLVASIVLLRSGKSMDVVLPTVGVLSVAGLMLGLMYGGPKQE
jgi:hypothetical protein